MNSLAEVLVCRADNAPSDPAFSFIENDEGQISQLSNAELASWAWCGLHGALIFYVLFRKVYAHRAVMPRPLLGSLYKAWRSL